MKSELYRFGSTTVLGVNEKTAGIWGSLSGLAERTGLGGVAGRIGKSVIGRRARIGPLEAALGGLGLYSAGSDIYEGLKNRSLGQMAMGAVGLPMSLAGWGVMANKNRTVRLPWFRRLAKSYPSIARVPGARHLGHAVDWTEKAVEGLGGHVTGAVGKGLAHVGAPGAGEWVKNIGPVGKQALGFMLAQQGMNAALGVGGGGSSASTMQPGYMRQAPVYQNPTMQNVAPQPEW